MGLGFRVQGLGSGFWISGQGLRILSKSVNAHIGP